MDFVINTVQSQKEEPEQLKLSHFQSLLPKKTYERLLTIERMLLIGNAAEAVTEVLTLRKEFMTPSVEWHYGIPVNLQVEDAVRKLGQLREDATDSSMPERKIQTFIRFFVEPTNKLGDFYVETVTRRKLSEWQKIGKSLHRYKDLSHNAMALTALFVLNGGPKLKAAVTSENLSQLSEFVKVSLDLGGFPLIEPVFDDSVPEAGALRELKYLLVIQNELLARNQQGYKSSLLHILADQPSLTPEQHESLSCYLGPHSFQRVNLLQPDAEGKTPLAIAFENSNIDFIASVLESGACDDLDFDCLFFSKNAKVDSICAYLSPQPLDQLSRKRQQDENQQIKVLKILRGFFKRRPDLSQLLADIKARELRMLQGLDRYGNLAQKLWAFESVKGTFNNELRLWEEFPKLEACQRWLVNTLASAEVTTMPLEDQLTIAYFGSARLQFGLGVLQLTVSSTASELASLVDECPGFGYLLHHGVAYAFKQQKTLENLRKIEVRPALFDSNDSCYLSAFKLAFLYQPEAEDLHLMLAEAAHTNKMLAVFHLEFLALVGGSLGVQSKAFEEIFAQKPWQFAAQENLNIEEPQAILSDQATDLLTSTEFEELLQRLAAILIQNQNVDKLGRYLLSLRGSYLNNSLVESFLYLCRIYLQPRCFVPLFAICANDYYLSHRLQSLDNQALVEDRFIAGKYDRPHLKRLKVTQEEVSTCVAIWTALVAYQNNTHCKRLRIEEFFSCVADGPLSDELVNFITSNNLKAFHFGAIDTAGLSTILRRENLGDISTIRPKMLPITNRFDFCSHVLRNCSIETIAQFFKADFDYRVKFRFCKGLFPLYLINAVLQITYEADKNESTGKRYYYDSNQRQGNRRKATTILPIILDDAISFPQQAAMLQQAVEDIELGAELADRFGVDLNEFDQRAQEALTKLKGESNAYAYDQIAATGGPLKRDTSVAAKSGPRPMIKIQAMVRQDRNNPIQHAIYERKFDLVLGMLRRFFELADQEQLDVFIQWMKQTLWNRSNTHENLINLVNSENEQYRNLIPKSATFTLRFYKLISQIFKRHYREARLQYEPLLEELAETKLSFEIIYSRYKKLIQAYMLFRPLEYRLRMVYRHAKGDLFWQKRILSCTEELYSIISEDFDQLLRLDQLCMQLKGLQQMQETDPTVEKFFSIYDNQWLEEISREIRVTEHKQRALGRLVEEWRPYDQFMVKAFLDCFAKILAMENERKYAVSDFIPYWFAIMSPEQIEACVTDPFNWFECECIKKSLNLSMFLERQDLPISLLKQILYKAISVKHPTEAPENWVETVRSGDKQRVGQLIDYFIEDAEIKGEVMNQVLNSRILQRGRMNLTDLPPELLESCTVLHFIKTIEGSPNCPEESESNYLPLIEYLLTRMSVKNFLSRLERPFTWLCMHLGNNNVAFKMIADWVKQQTSISLLEHELNHPKRLEESETTLGWLMHTGRMDIVLRMVEYASPEIWQGMLTQRTKAYSTRTMRPWLKNDGVAHKLRGYWDSSDSESEEATPAEQLAGYNEMTPFFVALNLNQFELAMSLAPEEFGSINTCEYCLVIDKLCNGINPLTLDTDENKAKVKAMQDWLDSGIEMSSQDFPVIQLCSLMPGLALKLIKAAESSQDLILAQELAVSEDVKGNKAVEYFKRNPVRQALIKEASKHVLVLKFLIKSGVFGECVNTIFSEVMGLKLGEPHREVQNYLADLVIQFGFSDAPEIQAGLQMATKLKQPAVDDSYLTEMIAPMDSSFDKYQAFQQLLSDFSFRLVRASNDISYDHKSLKAFFTSAQQVPIEQQGHHLTEILIGLCKKKDLNQILEVLGFVEDELSTIQIDNLLTIEGKKADSALQWLRETIPEVTKRFKACTQSISESRVRDICQQSASSVVYQQTSTMPFASIWLGLCAHYKVLLSDYLPENEDLKQFISMMFDLRFDTIEDAKLVAKQLLEFAATTFKSNVNDGKLWLKEGVAWEFSQLSLEDPRMLSYQIWLLFLMHPGQEASLLDVLMDALFTSEQGTFSTAKAFDLGSRLCHALAQIDSPQQALVTQFAGYIVKFLKMTTSQLELHGFTSESFTELGDKLDKAGKLLTLFTPFPDVKKLAIKVSPDLLDCLFEIQEEESQHLKCLTLRIVPAVLEDEATFQHVLNGQRQAEVDELAKRFVSLLNKKYEGVSWVTEMPFRLSCSCPIEMGEALKSQVDSALLDQDFVKVLLSLQTNSSSQDYYRQISFEVNFATNYSQKDIFLRSFADYAARPQKLAILFTLSADGSLKLVPESFVPYLDNQLSSIHRQFFKKLKQGQTDVPVLVDYRDLVPRLAGISFADCDDISVFLFSRMKERFSDDTVFKSLKFIYEEIQNKLINLIGCFAAKSKSGVKFSQLKGVIVQFDPTSPNDTSLDMKDLNEDILDKPSDEFTEQAKRFEKVPSPFESKMIPKNYHSKVAVLTVKFA